MYSFCVASLSYVLCYMISVHVQLTISHLHITCIDATMVVLQKPLARISYTTEVLSLHNYITKIIIPKCLQIAVNYTNQPYVQFGGTNTTCILHSTQAFFPFNCAYSLPHLFIGHSIVVALSFFINNNDGSLPCINKGFGFMIC